MLAISLCLGSLVSVVVRHHRLKVRLVSNQRAFDGEKKRADCSINSEIQRIYY